MLHSRRLLQHFVINAFVNCELSDFNYFRFNQQTLRADFYDDVMNRLNNDYELNDIEQKIIVLFFNHVKFSRWLKNKKQNVLILIRKYIKFTFFITFICNSNWFELTRDANSDVSIENRFELINKIFELKLKKLLRDLIERHVLKIMNAHIYVIEFQKRDFFHAHILIIVDSRNEIIVVNVNVAIQIVIFDKVENENFHNLIVEHMIHKNCENNEKIFCHDEQNRCIKKFFKSFKKHTNLTHHTKFSFYRRTHRESIEKITYDNKWVVSYNFWLLQKYRVHINVEICINAKLVDYLYKYIFKRCDCVDVFINVSIFERRVNVSLANRRDKEFAIDEIKIFHDARWIEFCEIAWRLNDHFIDEIKLVVTRFSIHLKNQQRTIINSDDSITIQQLFDSEKFRKIMLIEYFAINRLALECENNDQSFSFVVRKKNKNIVVNSREIFYQDISKYFIWNKKNKTWIMRKKRKCVNRMYYMNFKFDDVFYLRLLFCNRKKIIFFENLKTIDMQISKISKNEMKSRFFNYKQICVKLDLIDDDDEWNVVMIEITEFDTTTMFKKLFVTILTECAFVELLQLWNTHKKT